MRSGDDELMWWIDLPKLITLTGSGDTFRYPRSITLEGISYHSILTNRHALSHHCYSSQGCCFLLQENPSYEQFLFLLSLIPRHHLRSPKVSPVHCFFHIPIPTPNRRFHFTQQLLSSFLIVTLSILTSLSHVMLLSIPSNQFSHYVVIPEINPSTSYASKHNHYWLYCSNKPGFWKHNTQLLLSCVFHS